MSKLERKNHKVFGINATETKVGQFGSANATTKITTKDVEKIQALDAWEQGWEAGAIGNNRYPTQQERTGVDYEHSYQIGYMLQEGIPEWNKDTTYNKGSIVKVYNGTTLQIYVSLVDDNLNNAVTDSAKWKSGLANSDLSNLTEAGEKHFLNKSQVTNCILEAPNGVATYMGDTLTVKQGLKVLIPNGRNDDGTLKNIEYTLENDITKTITTTYEHKDFFFIKNDGTCFIFGTESIAFYNKLADRPTPATGVYNCCFVYETNFWYVTSNGSPYEELKMALLGTVSNNASSQITSLTSKLPFMVADKQEIDGMWVIKPYDIINSITSLTNGYDQYRSYDISSYLPNDDCVYEVLVEILGQAGQIANAWVQFWVNDAVFNSMNVRACSCGARSYSTIPAYVFGSGILLISSRTLRLGWTGIGGGTPSISRLGLIGYRKVR